MQLGRRNYTIFSTLALLTLASRAALAEPPVDLGATLERRDPAAESLLAPLLPSSLSSWVRSLARSTRSGATGQLARLLERAGSQAGQPAEEAAYLAVRALAERSARSAEARTALLLYLRSEPEGEVTALGALARATAAMGLARSGKSETLLLLARSGERAEGRDAQSVAIQAARAALLVYPPAPELLQEVQTHFPLVSSPPAALACHVPEKLTDREEARLALLRLTTCEIPQEFNDKLRPVAKSSPAWVLRAATLLTGRGMPAAAWTKELARDQLRAPSSVVRSAAAWFLATAEPERIPALLRSEQAEIRAAARNQLLATGAAHLITDRPELLAAFDPAAAPETPGAALLRDAILQLPSLWPELSETTFEQLRQAIDAGDPRPTAPLASRTNRGLANEGLLPPGQPASPLTRAAIAQGLGEATSSHRMLALGMLRRGYDQEAHPGVRRVLCAALTRQVRAEQDSLPGQALGAFLRRAAESDPDPFCRAAFAPEQFDASGTTVFVSWTNQEAAWAARSHAAPLLLSAAPDGFVGAVGADTPFTECGTPAAHLRQVEACDWPSQSPR